MKSWFAHPETFSAYSASHVAVLFVTAFIVVWMCLVARRKVPGLAGARGEMCEKGQARVLAVILFLGWPLKLWVFRMMGANYVLPMHLCDWAGIVGGIALWTRRPLAAELVYFWGLAGTLNGLLTPDLGQEFPHPRFFVFFALHAGVVITSLYVVIGLQLFPRPGAVWRVFGWTQVYVASAFVANMLTSTSGSIESNYGFLLHKPLDASNPVLNALGEWPWYILGLQVVCLVFFLVLYSPFWWRRRKGRVEGKG